MSGRGRICLTLVGDITRDSRCSRFAASLARDHDVDVIALGSSDKNFTHESAQVSQRAHREAHSLRASLWDFWSEGLERAVATGAGLFLASDLYSLPVAAEAAKRRGAALMYDSRELYPAIASLRRNPLTRAYWRWIERRHASDAACISTVNESIASILRKRYSGTRVEVLPNVPRAWSGSSTERLRQALAIPRDSLILLSQGGLQSGRGAELYIDCLPELPGCFLVFLGDGPLVHALTERATALGVPDRVAFLPAVPTSELLEWTSSADIGLCMIEKLGLSYYLSLPNKLFEYMMAAVPVIGSDFPEIERVVHGNGIGITVDPENRAAFIRAVRTMSSDRVLRETCAAAARQARVHYTWETQALRLERIVADLLRER